MDIDLNILAVLVSALVHFALGALWYSPLLFARKWAQLKGIDMDDANADGPSPVMFLGSFLSGLALATGLAVVLSVAAPASLGAAIVFGLIVGVAFTAAPQFANAMFGGDVRVWLIDAGYPLVSIVIMTAILHLWS